MSSERDDMLQHAEHFATLDTKQRQSEGQKLDETVSSRRKALNSALTSYHSTVHDAEEAVRTVRKEKTRMLGELNRLSRDEDKARKRKARKKAARKAGNGKSGGGSAFAGVDEDSQLRQDLLLAKHEVDLKRKAHAKLVTAQLEALRKREQGALDEIARVRVLLLKKLSFAQASGADSVGAVAAV
jgi:hypothetical protein